MYANCFSRWGCALIAVAGLASPGVLGRCASAQQPLPPLQSSSVVRNIARATERIDMTVNTSQILTLGTRIPRLVVNNPELVTATPISETQIQIAARKPGVTQINLWDENGQVYTVDLLIFGDVRELEMALKRMFPQSSISVTRLTNSLVLTGQVDRPEVVSTVFRLAEDYAPKVVSDLTVGGVQEVILKVKVMEVSRTKLRRMGTDFAVFGDNGFFASSVSDIIQTFSNSPGSAVASGQTIEFGVIGNDASFLGFLDWLEQNNVSKIMADPTLVAMSGRPASFLVGGELPILVPSGLGQTTIEYKDFGTQVDFVPIVLGNGRIRLEVRPRLSEIDDSRSVVVSGFTIPALKVRQVDTGVEMNAGQTLALAGLIQERIESQKRGLPYVMDLPIVGVPFRRVQEQVNEIENLVLVTPDFVDAMDPCEVPQCGPGMETMSPSRDELYWKGHIEVPACGPCGASQPCTCNAPGLGCSVGAPCGAGGCNNPYVPGGAAAMATDGMPTTPTPMYGAPAGVAIPAITPTPAEPTLPAEDFGPQMEPVQPGGASPPDPAANMLPPQWQRTASADRTMRTTAPAGPMLGEPATSTPGLIGPIGYDVQK
ncbi:MAG TPA: pilus assembly protein N-terminal domain-containing protein [Lacipirellulaceae bacterium]|nr:pilus assembly protein N-terminal domain-containing protein [Lacipirellulaceae bacterium]